MRWFVLVMLVMLTSVSQVGAQTERLASGDARCDRLARGVNLSHWFFDPRAAQDLSAYYATFISNRDAQLIADAGFTHVRIPVDIAALYDYDVPDVLNAGTLAALDAAVQLFTARGIAVVIVPTGRADSDVFNLQLIDRVFGFWTLFSSYVSKFDPTLVYVQIFNEPVGQQRVWQSLQGQILTIARAGAPEHTFIVSTAKRHNADLTQENQVEAFAQFVPYDDPNVVYSLHFFDPMIFTHQGADWIDWTAALANVPYPSTPDNVASVTVAPEALSAAGETPGALDWLPDYVAAYGEQRWNRETLAQFLVPVFEWKTAHQACVMVGQFGVFRLSVREEDRLQWLSDVRALLEEHSIGWSMWDYVGGFSVVVPNSSPTARTLDPFTLQALGLTS